MIPKTLEWVFGGSADVRGSYGGRGSGKTRSFATMTAVRGYEYGMQGIRGQILCARQYMNSLADSSLEEIKRSIADHAFLADYYEIGTNYVRSRDGRISYTFYGLDRNIASIKSQGRILLCWVDEAETISEAAYTDLIPTLREEGDGWNAELWVTWNPARKGSPTDKRFRDNPDVRYKVAQLNWRENPWFPAVLERQRLRDMEQRPDDYAHVWEGDYITTQSGAYYAKALAQAKREGRAIGRLSPDPLLSLNAFWDIGGTGAKADACAIWIVQFVGKEVRFLDYYEAQGQPLAAHVEWLRSHGYGAAEMVLPHDGRQGDKVYDVSYESELIRAGFSVRVIDNQGKGAAMSRIEASRRLFPSMWFDCEKCAAGLDAIGWYHPKIDKNRGIDLGPEHDWSSHGADAFGMVAVAYEIIQDERKPKRPAQFQPTFYGGQAGWMGA